MEYTINVTQKNIDEGVRFDSGEHTFEVGCMAERAIRDATGDVRASIGFRVGQVNNDSFHVHPDDAAKVAKLIADFDKGATVGPFTFRIVMDDA